MATTIDFRLFFTHELNQSPLIQRVFYVCALPSLLGYCVCMQREGVIEIICKLRGNMPMGLYRYKLIEELKLVCFSSRARKRSRMRNLISVIKGAPPKGPQRASKIKPECVRCGYDLSGLDSVLGPRLPVGPSTCPECGKDYPAVW